MFLRIVHLLWAAPINPQVSPLPFLPNPPLRLLLLQRSTHRRSQHRNPPVNHLHNPWEFLLINHRNSHQFNHLHNHRKYPPINRRKNHLVSRQNNQQNSHRNSLQINHRRSLQVNPVKNHRRIQVVSHPGEYQQSTPCFVSNELPRLLTYESTSVILLLPDYLPVVRPVVHTLVPLQNRQRCHQPNLLDDLRQVNLRMVSNPPRVPGIKLPPFKNNTDFVAVIINPLFSKPYQSIFFLFFRFLSQ